MADTPRTPDDNTEGEDAELIAYLDGELDADAAARVEAQIARDPHTREKADAYRKTFDLLDYLPQREPDPTFTTRTLTRLQPAPDVSATRTGHTLAPAHSSTVVVPTKPRRLWPELAAWTTAVILAGVLGYFIHLAARPHLNASQKDAQPTASEIAMIEKLPLYIGVDDLEFLKKLEESDLFDDPLTIPADAVPAVNRFESDEPLEQPTPANRQKLVELFMSYPPIRQQQIRVLHQQLSEQELAARQSLMAILTRYALWLDRLPDADRKEILAAATAHARMDTIQSVVERHWRAALPPPQQESIKKVPNEIERQRLIKELRDRQHARQAEWVLAQRQWQQMTGPDRKPWPFSDPVLAKQIDEYLRTALGVDISQPLRKIDSQPTTSRLTADDIRDLRSSHDAAIKEGYWFSYGACLLRLAERHPSLPRPAREATLIVSPKQVPDDWKKVFPKEGKKSRLDGTVGRWPDFALELHRTAIRPDSRLSPLGPCKPGEFEESFEKFLKEKLLPVLSEEQKKKLAQAEGKWPAYPQEAIALAREKNLSVPGITLPGEPREWERYYRLQPLKK